MAHLAIVIPAFKGEFLYKTLDSLEQQTNKDFFVYIGNDDGDVEIECVIAQFLGRLNMMYTRFTKNLGGTSLVKQWLRCFQLTQGEEWLWLLPDDDYPDTNCVELFYAQAARNDFDVFRFNAQFVTADEKLFKVNKPLPPVQDAFDSLLEKLSFARPGTVAEYIFSRKKFEQTGFAEIPMAWGTDDLLWFLMGKEKGIYGCNEASVYLRQSHLNISNNYTSLGPRKIAANFIFFDKLVHSSAFKAEMKTPGRKEQFRKIAVQHILYNLQDFSMRLSMKDIMKYAAKGSRVWGGGLLRNMRRFYLNNQRVAKKKQSNG